MIKDKFIMIVVAFFALWLIVLPFRSILYILKIYNEFKTGKPAYKPNVNTCSIIPYETNNFEDERLLNYRKFDTKCEK